MACSEPPATGTARLLENWFRSYRPYLKVVAVGLLGDKLPNDASDAVNNGLLLAFRHFVQCRATNAAGFLKWLTAIVRHEACRIRGAVPTQALPEGSSGEEWLASDSPGPDVAAMRREQAARLLGAISRLPEHYRTVINLRHHQKLCFEEVARQMSRSCAAVRQLWLRALDHLRAEMGEVT
jgi:RNA polymerase sigma-70 factor (ECF subfamily)